MDATTAKRSATEAVEASLDELVALSREIHAHPETNFEEHLSSAWTADVLERHGFSVERGSGGVETAFVARAGHGSLVASVCAEYDALPSVGHACGHNLIAASSVGAGIGLAGVADELDMTVQVIGTPAEEGGGGKIALLDAGVFDTSHLAVMVHPAPIDCLEPRCLATAHFDITFTGRTAHASAAPWVGVNAADAMVIAQVAIGLLRQQLPPGNQVHGIVTQGGEAANIIPGRAEGRFMIRAYDTTELADLERRVMACFEAGALATGTTMTREDVGPVYSHLVSDPDLKAFYRSNAEAMGRHFLDAEPGVSGPTLSTDMANVSLAVPSIHPLIGFDTGGAVNHQPEFAAATITPAGEATIRDGAIALAHTVIDAASSAAVRSRLLA